MASKRRNDSDNNEERVKRLKLTTASSAGPSSVVDTSVADTSVAGEQRAAVDQSSTAIGNAQSSTSQPKNKRKGKANQRDRLTHPPRGNNIGSDAKPKYKINKLVPPRPFPTVPTSVSATGPRSAHVEGKNHICVTRKTPLGMYLRRCKDVFMKDGYKTLHLSALGAAIPHLLTLSVSLPPILPFPRDEIHTEVRTGTVEVYDELVPEDEDEDIEYRSRGKSSLSVVIRIGDGDDEGASSVKGKPTEKNRSGTHGKGKGKETQPIQVVFQEPEQEDMDDT